MEYAISFQGVVIAVFAQVGHRDYLWQGLVAAFGEKGYEKVQVKEVQV